MMRRTNYKSPTILVVTPEITYLPEGMGNMANVLHAKAGGCSAREPTCTSRCRTTARCSTSTSAS